MTEIIPIDEISARARRAADDRMSIATCPYPDDSDAARRWQIAYHGREMELMEEASI